MSNKYKEFAQQKAQENTDMLEVLPATVIDLALNGNQDITGLSNPGGAGMIVFIKLNAEVGVAGLTPSIFLTDPDGSVFLYRTEAELTASGTVAYVYYPGVSTGATSINGANITAAANVPIPGTFGIRLAKSTGDSDQNFTATVTVQYLR